MEAIYLPSLSAFSIKGKDARQFLQGQLTCDLNDLKPNEALLGAHCNKEGRVVALYYLIEQGTDEILLITQKDVLSEAMKTLKHYGMFSKLTWQEHSNLKIFGIIGQPNTELKAIKIPSLKNHYFVLNSIESAQNDEASWYYSLIQSKQAFLTQASMGKFLPQELDLEAQSALSYTKGCYLGQEIIARLHYLGKLKRSLRTIETQKILKPLEELHNQEKIIGEVVASCEYNDKCYALALIDINIDTACVLR